jgi:hypothetical protein
MCTSNLSIHREQTAIVCLYATYAAAASTVLTPGAFEVNVVRLGALPPKTARLIATHVVGSDIVTTEEGIPFSDEEIAAVYERWYQRVTEPGSEHNRVVTDEVYCGPNKSIHTWKSSPAPTLVDVEVPAQKPRRGPYPSRTPSAPIQQLGLPVPLIRRFGARG